MKIVDVSDSRELADLVRQALTDAAGEQPDEYEPQKFSVEIEGLEILVIIADELFPAIRFEHRVLEIAPADRHGVLEFLNALHGRTSTLGAHWWLGDRYVWQAAALWAWTFDSRTFNDLLGVFVEVAHDRTAEIRARFDGSWPELGEA